MKKIIALSIFSGCGGLDIGSHQAGIPVLGSLDFDKDSTETLKNNSIFKKTKVFHTDISDFDVQKYKEILKNNKHEKFILIGGPPCQPFSKAGYWVGNDTRKKDKDPRNMVGEYLRMAKELKPDGFLFENVESLLHPSNKHVVDEIIKYVEKLGYSTKIIKTNKEPPFIDFFKTSESKAMIVLTYESEQGVVGMDDDFRRMWTKLQRSRFVSGLLAISEGLVSWML